MEAGFAREPGHGLAEKRLGSEGDDRFVSLCLESFPVLDAALTKSLLVHHIEGCSVGPRQLDSVAAADLQMSLLVDSLCSK